jgi:Gpi18-like mannosyltransferase
MKNIYAKYKYLIVYPFLFINFSLLAPVVYNWTGDLQHFINWGSYNFVHGLKNAFKSGTDYPPVFQYIFMLFVWTQSSVEGLVKNINFLKTIILIFDFLSVFIAFRFFRQRGFSIQNATFYSLFILLNIAYLYNTLVWGQVDATYTFFIFTAFYCAYHKHISLTLIFSILALNAKLYSFIFFPLILLMLAPTLLERLSIFNLIKWIAIGFFTQALILLPFYFNGDIPRIKHILFKQSLSRPQNLSASAYNLWHWVSNKPHEELNSGVFLGVSYKFWGLGSFVLAYFIMILPLLITTLKRILIKKYQHFSLEKFLLIGAIIPLIFYFFPTQMHERYAHASIIFAGTYAILSKKWLIYFTISSAYFLNLEDFLRHRYANTHYFFFDSKFIAVLFALAIALIIFELYKKSYTSKNS